MFSPLAVGCIWNICNVNKYFELELDSCLDAAKFLRLISFAYLWLWVERFVMLFTMRHWTLQYMPVMQ